MVVEVVALTHQDQMELTAHTDTVETVAVRVVAAVLSGAQTLVVAAAVVVFSQGQVGLQTLRAAAVVAQETTGRMVMFTPTAMVQAVAVDGARMAVEVKAAAMAALVAQLFQRQPLTPYPILAQFTEQHND